MLPVTSLSSFAAFSAPVASVATASRAGALRMGFGPSPKELSSDPPIPEVLKIVKADQAERFARASLDGAAFAVTLPGVCAPFGFFDPLDLVPKDQESILMWREAE